MPPKPVKTRWCTWLDSIEYYIKNMSKYMEVIAKIPDDHSSKYLTQLKTLLNNSSQDIWKDILTIDTNYKSISIVIKELQGDDMLLEHSLKLALLETKLCSLKDPIGRKIYSKFSNVFKDNEGLLKMVKLSKVISENSNITFEKLSTEEILCFRRAPVTSCSVERSFSKHKLIFSELRQNLSEENMRFHIISNFNSNLKHCLINKT